MHGVIFTYYDRITNKLRKLFEKTNRKISYKTGINAFYKMQTETKIEEHDKNEMHKIQGRLQYIL